MKRVVVDTNISISALFWSGLPRKVMDLARVGRIVLLTSREIEAELVRVLAYGRFGLPPAEIIPIVNDLRRLAVTIETRSRFNAIVDDPTDNIFLDCAVDGNADMIVSGDRHLLSLGMIEGIPIMRARDFLTEWGHLD